MVGQETLGPFRSVLLQNELNQPKHVNSHTPQDKVVSVLDIARSAQFLIACPLEHLRQPLHGVSVNAY